MSPSIHGDGRGSPRPVRSRGSSMDGGRGASGASVTSPKIQRKQERILLVHDAFHEVADVVLSSTAFPHAVVGDTVQLKQAKSMPIDVAEAMGNFTGAQEEVAALLTVAAVKPLSSQAAVSVSKAVATALGFTHRCHTAVRVLGGHVEREAASLSLVTLLFKGQYIGRADMNHMKQSLVGKCVHLSKKVLYGAICAEVYGLQRDGATLTSGLITEDTKFVFRSKSAKMFVFVQLSREMWDFAEDSNIYFERATAFLRDLFQKWKAMNANHSVTVIFFSRCFYPPSSTMEDLLDIAPPDHLPQSTMHMDARGRRARDFFKIIIDNETRKDWAPALRLLKAEFRSYPQHIGWCSPEEQPHSRQHRSGLRPPVLSVNSSATEGNVLEAINLALNEFDKHHIDRDLTHTGQNILLLSAGSGYMDVDANLAALTKQRMLDNSICCDMVCVRKPPLHVVPLFRYFNYSEKKKRSRAGLSSVAPAGAQSEQLDGQPGAQSHTTLYKIPYWIYISFYSPDSEVGGEERLTHSVPSAVIEYFGDGQEEPQFFTPNKAWASCNSYMASKLLVSKSQAPIPTLAISPSMAGSSPEPLGMVPSPTASSAISTDGRQEKARISSSSASPNERGKHSLCSSPMMMGSNKLTAEVSPGNGMGISYEEYNQMAHSYSRSMQDSTPMFAADLALTMKRSPKTKRKKKAPLWPTDLASIPTYNTSSSRRWSHLFPKPLAKLTPACRNATAPNLLTNSANWESLTAPACLPLVSEFFPSDKDLAKKFFQGTYTLSLLPGEDVYQNKTEDMLQERLAQNYQLVAVDEKKRAVKGVHRLALGQVFHIISCDGGAQNVTVRRFYHKNKVYDIPSVHYQYALWPINHTAFRRANVDIKFENITTVNWNYVDRMICGEEETSTYEKMRWWKIHFAVIPSRVEADHTAAAPCTPLEEKKRIAAFTRFMGSLLRRNRIFKHEHRLEIEVASQFAAEAESSKEKSPRGGAMGAGGDALGEDVEEEDTLSAIVRQMREVDSGLEIEDRKYLLRTFRRCFVGSEAVDWVMRHVDLQEDYSRDAAGRLMQRLMDERFFQPVQGKGAKFADGKHFYRFVDDQNVVDIRKVALRARRRKQAAPPTRARSPPPVDETERAPAALQRAQLTDRSPSVDMALLGRSPLARAGSLPMLAVSGSPRKSKSMLEGVPAPSLAGRFAGSARKALKVEVADPEKQTDRYQWILLQYDETFHPWSCFHLDIKWMMCTGSAVKEIVSHMQRQARQCGVTMIQVPADRDVARHPFRAPVRIPLPSTLDVDRHALLTQLNFILYERSRDSLVYMHRTGVAFLDLSSEGLLWTYNYTPVLQPLAAMAQSLLQQLEDLCAGVRSDADIGSGDSDTDSEHETDSGPEMHADSTAEALAAE